MTQLANPKPAVMYSAIFLGTVPPGTAPADLSGAARRDLRDRDRVEHAVARLFSLDRTRARYISLKTVIDRTFGAALAALGVKVALP
jgi:threonine/homoserine/homoserine lactone efflux protein